MGNIRFEYVCKQWMEEKSKTVKTTSLAAYSLIIDKHLAPRFNTLDDITPDSVRSIVRYDLDNHLKINTIKSILLVLKMIIKYSEEKGWMKHINLFSRMLPHGEMSDPQVLTVDEERAFVYWLKEHPTKLNIGLLLCVCCGLRIGEVCALRWEDIDLRRKVIQIRRTVYRVYNPKGEPHKRTKLKKPLFVILGHLPDRSAKFQEQFQKGFNDTWFPHQKSPQPPSLVRHTMPGK